MKNKAISLLSGGLDSAVATILASRRFKIALAITFDYGQRAAKNEIRAAKRLCRTLKIKHETIRLPWLKKITHTALVDRRKEIPRAKLASLGKQAAARVRAVWVPNRNGVFVAVAAAFAESLKYDAVVAGFNAEEAAEFPDNSLKFISAANKGLEFSTLKKIKIVAPTAKMRKKELFRCLVRLGIDPKSVWSCYEGGKNPCGRCESCVRFGLIK